MPKVTLPDSKILEVPAGATAADAIGKIGKRLLEASLAAEVDGRKVDLNFPLPEACTLKAFTFSSPEGKEVFRHSSAHLLAQAVMRIYPDAKPTIGPAVEEGFYYDFAGIPPLSPADLGKIEEEMAKIVLENQPSRRAEISKSEAQKLFAGNRFKLEMID